MAPMRTIAELPTPALLLDLEILHRNLSGMAERAEALGVALRPHIKTHKCLEIAALQREYGAQGLTVSTLHEAKVFAAHGYTDLTWAFPLVPSRVDEAAELVQEVTLRLVIDSHEVLDILDRLDIPLHVWIKVDCGYHRAGVDPHGDQLTRLAERITETRQLAFDGLLTHSGQAYGARSVRELARVADEERRVMVAAAQRLRDHGIRVPAVSVGSTPAISAAEDLTGITEIRPGNYALYDGMQVGLGAAAVRDCAATVLTIVVSSQARHCVVDAGALALSKDLGLSSPEAPCYGSIFADYDAGLLEETHHLVSLSQEHGIVDRSGTVGERMRVLPNHSCLTVAQFDQFYVVEGERVVDRWPIHRGRG